MGQLMFDAGEVPWGEEPPFRAAVFVVTSRPREPLERKGGMRAAQTGTVAHLSYRIIHGGT